MIAIIGGTGIYDPKIFRKVEKKKVKTPYGASPEVFIGKIEGKNIAFLPRHGQKHTVPPHKINYRANIYALKAIGVERIISINSVGSINEILKPGSVVVPHDFIDCTKGRESTFYDNEAVHVDVSIPYCPEVRNALTKAADKSGKVFSNAIYACTQGPRFETPAEIRMLATLGCDIVGMVGFPEVVLTREKEMCYASICTVTNYAAGIAKKKLTAIEVKETVGKNEDKLKKIILHAIKGIPEKRMCGCGHALEGARF